MQSAPVYCRRFAENGVVAAGACSRDLSGAAGTERHLGGRGPRRWWPAEMQRNGVVECSVCRNRLVVPSPRSVSRAYDKHRSKISSKFRALNVFLVVGDCILVGLQVRCG